MKKHLQLIFILCLCLHLSLGDLEKCSPKLKSLLEQSSDSNVLSVWIQFYDKPSVERMKRDKTDIRLYEIQEGIDERAIWRRSKLKKSSLRDLQIHETDVPVDRDYISAVLNLGAELRRESKWLNSISVTIPRQAIKSVSDLPFVSNIELLSKFRKPLEKPEDPEDSAWSYNSNSKKEVFDYGLSRNQIYQMRSNEIHEKGNYGQNVRILVLDSGFTIHESVAHVTIIDQYDFINHVNSTTNQPSEDPDQIKHGTSVLSIIAGKVPGELYGPAFGAEFLLAKTEDISSETVIEEDNFVAALEWGEALGADLATASLGYNDWYTFEQLDGKTGITTKAVNIAVTEKGMAVTVSAGNSGYGGMSVPSDSPYAIAVGAIDRYGAIGYFSSRGETYDGVKRPDVVAMGVKTWCADAGNYITYQYLSGTSMAAPLIAGVVAQLLSGHPDWTPDQLRQALFSTASLYPNPTIELGFGVVDVVKAMNFTPKVCPNECSQKGQCIDYHCVCDEGRYGFDCSLIKTKCFRNCHFGHCETDQCVCNEGYRGLDCSQAEEVSSSVKLIMGYLLALLLIVVNL